MPSRSSFRDVDRGFGRALAVFRGLRATDLRVGILEPEGGETRDGGGLTLAGIAAVNEFGSGDGRIPERSFIRSTWDRNSRTYAGKARMALSRVVAGALSAEQALGQFGAEIAGDIQEANASGVGPSNASATIKRKGSSKPLIDTGRLRQSIRFRVEPRGGGR